MILSPISIITIICLEIQCNHNNERTWCSSRCYKHLITVPNPKNERGNNCNSNNYKQIAISSILGKIFDIIVLDAQYDSLSTDVYRLVLKIIHTLLFVSLFY